MLLLFKDDTHTVTFNQFGLYVWLSVFHILYIYIKMTFESLCYLQWHTSCTLNGVKANDILYVSQDPLLLSSSFSWLWKPDVLQSDLGSSLTLTQVLVGSKACFYVIHLWLDLLFSGVWVCVKWFKALPQTASFSRRFSLALFLLSHSLTHIYAMVCRPSPVGESSFKNPSSC